MDLLSFFVAVLPVFLIGLYIYNKDNVKESSKLLFKLFSYGFLSCIPVVIVGLLFDRFFPDMENMNLIQLFIYTFITVAFVEEFFKWLFVYKGTYRHDEFDSSYDMIIYASFVALGFACFENILYVSSFGIVTGFFRALLAVPGHACDGILMGIYLGLAKMSEIKGNNKLSNRYKILSVFVPTIIHGIYDFCLFVGNILFVGIFLLFVIIIDVICIIKIRQISQNDIKFKYQNNYCTGCGLPVKSNFCPRCGNKNI